MAIIKALCGICNKQTLLDDECATCFCIYCGEKIITASVQAQPYKIESKMEDDKLVQLGYMNLQNNDMNNVFEHFETALK